MQYAVLRRAAALDGVGSSTYMYLDGGSWGSRAGKGGGHGGGMRSAPPPPPPPRGGDVICVCCGRDFLRDSTYVGISAPRKFLQGRVCKYAQGGKLTYFTDASGTGVYMCGDPVVELGMVFFLGGFKVLTSAVWSTPHAPTEM